MRLVAEEGLFLQCNEGRNEGTYSEGALTATVSVHLGQQLPLGSEPISPHATSGHHHYWIRGTVIRYSQSRRKMVALAPVARYAPAGREFCSAMAAAWPLQETSAQWRRSDRVSSRSKVSSAVLAKD